MAKKIDLELVKELRDKTGLGLMDCKKALIETDGNIEKAIVLLRKKGAKIAAKRSSKETSEGVIQAYIHPGNRIGALVEVNCETDFVARTEDVKNFTYYLAMQIAAEGALYIAPEDVDKDFIEKERKIMKVQIGDSNKPENVIDKIIDGKLKKIYSDICLLEQQYIKNINITVKEALKEIIGRVGENIKIKRFVRFEVGQK